MNTPSKTWYTYILECEDNSLYVGATNNLERRFKEHQKGLGSKYVRSKKARRIVYWEEFDDKYAAFKRERQIKDFSRLKKLNLIK